MPPSLHRRRTRGIRTAAPALSCACPAETEVTSPALQQAASGPKGVRRRALVVNDEPDLAHLLAGMLRRSGFLCDFAFTGWDAQSLLSKQDSDVILCDLRVPDMDGETLFAWIKAERPWLCVRIGFMAGDALGRADGADRTPGSRKAVP